MRVSTFKRGSRGTALVMGLILSVVVTGMIITLAWAAGVQTKMTGDLTKFDVANFAAEAGSQRAAWYLKHNQSVAQPLTGTLNGGASYSVTWSAIAANTYRVVSVGTQGTACNTVQVTVKVPTVQAVISVGGDIHLKNLSINGNAIIGGVADFAPGNAQVNGNLSYGDSVMGTSSVTGTSTRTPWQGIDWTTVQTALAAAAGGATGLPGTSITYNFNALAGTNKVIVVTGNVTNPVIVGSGTLYVIGSVSVGGDVGSTTNPVNIVATGDITLTSNLTYYGALYTKGTLTRRKLDLYGTIYAEEDLDSSSNGSSSLNFTTAPWFETRSSGGATGTTQFMNYAGAAP